MVFRRLLLLSGLLLPLSGCAWAVRQQADQVVRGLAAEPFDVAPEAPRPPAARPGETAASRPRQTTRKLLASASSRPMPVQPPAPAPKAPTDAQATALMGSRRDASRPVVPLKDDAVLAAAWTQPGPGDSGASQRRLDLEISPRLPGSEAPRIVLPRDEAAAERAIALLFPELPPLPAEPKPLPGPGGKPYTLADLQRLAAANSPALRQAASDVQAAQGDLVQAGTYPNPVTGYIQDTSAVNNTGGVQAGFVDQPILTGGKMKLGVAMSQKDLDNAVLALKRARMDLATSVRNAYFTLLVDVETLAVTRALAQFSDEIYRLQTGLLKGTQAAPYEPTALRAQAYLNRLAYRQAIASYVYDWKVLVATLGLPQLPLSEVAGRVDRFVPYYDFDEVRAYVLEHHTDILTARNGVKRAQYNLKLAQVTPLVPNLDARDLPGPRPGPAAAHLEPEQGEHHRRAGGADPRQQGGASGRGRADQQPGPGVRELPQQPVRHRVLPPQRPAQPGALLPRDPRPPADRPQLGLRRPGLRPAEPVHQRGNLPGDPPVAVDVGGERGGPAADRRPVPDGETIRPAGAARLPPTATRAGTSRPRRGGGVAARSRPGRGRPARPAGHCPAEGGRPYGLP
jgi:Outer membrane efflux protein